MPKFGDGEIRGICSMFPPPKKKIISVLNIERATAYRFSEFLRLSASGSDPWVFSLDWSNSDGPREKELSNVFIKFSPIHCGRVGKLCCFLPVTVDNTAWYIRYFLRVTLTAPTEDWSCRPSFSSFTYSSRWSRKLVCSGPKTVKSTSYQFCQ